MLSRRCGRACFTSQEKILSNKKFVEHKLFKAANKCEMTKTPRAASDMRTNTREILAPYIVVPKSLGGLVARALFTAVRRARATASARALDRAMIGC